MTKTKLFETVMELCQTHKANKKLTSALEELLKPKTGGGVVQYPMIVDNDINYHYCRYTGYYLPESEMVMSKGKSKGYSKKAIAKWTKIGRDAKALEAEAMKLLLAKDFEAGTAKNNEAEELLNNRNKTNQYGDVREDYKDMKLDVAE